MRTTSLMPAPPTSRLGFILAHETLCVGVIPAEWDGDNQPVFYDSRVEAEAERVDASEMRADALEDARMEPEDGDDGPWVEAAVLHPDGSLTMLDVGLTFSSEMLRSVHGSGPRGDPKHR